MLLREQVSLFPDDEPPITIKTRPPTTIKPRPSNNGAVVSVRQEAGDDNKVDDNKVDRIRFINNKDGGWVINKTTTPSSVSVMRDDYEVGIIMKSDCWKYFIRRFRTSNGIAFHYSSTPLCVARTLDEIKAKVITLYN